jgi:hypothetical protein
VVRSVKPVAIGVLPARLIGNHGRYPCRARPSLLGSTFGTHRNVEMRYTGEVPNTSVQSLTHNFEEALRLMQAALADCPEDLWRTDLWPDEAATRPGPYGGLHGSAPWFLGYHALSCLDYDLSAEFEPWRPPKPFDENTYAYPNRVFTRPELLGYVDWCRVRVRNTLDALTEEMAARPVPSVHRKHGMLFGVVVGSLPLHVVEHASQIRQFLTAAGVMVQPMPGDQGYTG